MKYTQIEKTLFIKNRAKLAKNLDADSIAIFHSNDVMPRNGDAYHKFKQNSDLFYLTGIDQEDTILVVFPDCPNPMFKEALFIKETSESIKVWDGPKLNPTEAMQQSGIVNVFWYHDFWSTIHAVILSAENIYVNLNENDRFADLVPYNAKNLTKTIQNKYPAHVLKRAAPIMHNLRLVKEEEEITLIKKTAELTKHGLNRLLKFAKPGIFEYELEAELIHEFIRLGGTGFAFEPIIASGKNACILHYLENNTMVKDGDLILCDFGVEYGNYNSDITRCIPANGKFSPRQKDIYNAVLNVHKGARNLIKPGVTLPNYHAQVCEIMSEELVKLGLLTTAELKQNPKAFLKYYMHGTSHHLGLDVHDVMHRHTSVFEIGNVLTIEPGIYIPQEGIGVRIENDVLITKNGLYDFMHDFPIEVEEIENAMH